MFVGITNAPRDYAWGASGTISELLGTQPTGKPEAELWLGAHPGSPSRILDPAEFGAVDLAEWIDRNSVLALGDSPRLPFLLKVLAADSPLSLQAHPRLDQAREGFRRENEQGIPLDAPHRNYKDANHKPELIFALRDGFSALCGFRPVAQTRALLAPVETLVRPLLERLVDDTSIPAVFSWLLARGDDVDELVAEVSRAAHPALDTARALAVAYPGDPGIVISLLLNNLTLNRGEVLYLPAGNIHAYLFGLGVELMASSDNVLRGGLTTKHIDIDELLGVLDFTAGPPPYLPAETRDGARAFRPDVSDFELIEVSADALVPLGGPGIALCTGGSFELAGDSASVTISRGQAYFVTPDESILRATGGGELFIATGRQVASQNPLP